MRDLSAVLRACGSRHHELYDKFPAQADFKKVLLEYYQEAIARPARSASADA